MIEEIGVALLCLAVLILINEATACRGLRRMNGMKQPHTFLSWIGVYDKEEREHL